MGRTKKPADGKPDLKNMPPVKTAVTLSAEASHKLRSASLHEHKTQSEIMEALVMEHLGGYFTSKREAVAPAPTAGQGGSE